MKKPSTCSTVRIGLGAILAGVTAGFSKLLAGLGSDSPSAVNGELSLDDIRVLPLLRSAATVKGLRFPRKVHDWPHGGKPVDADYHVLPPATPKERSR